MKVLSILYRHFLNANDKSMNQNSFIFRIDEVPDQIFDRIKEMNNESISEIIIREFHNVNASMEKNKSIESSVHQTFFENDLIENFESLDFTLQNNEISENKKHLELEEFIANNKISIFNLKSTKEYTHLFVKPILAKNTDFDIKKFFKIGHRGNGKNNALNMFPRENTIESFLLPHKKGAQMIELDVHLTIDNVLVVHHNDWAQNELIANMTYADFIEKTDSSFENYRSTNTSLINIIENLPNDLAIYVEIRYESSIKYASDWDGTDYTPVYAKRLLESICEEILKHPNRNIMLACFDVYMCGLAKIVLPSYKVCLILYEKILHLILKSDLKNLLFI
jgi:glycerophosphoryl diester phosphodiesterase